MNELEQLTKRASEILGSEEAGKAFVDGFLKEAGMGFSQTFDALGKVTQTVVNNPASSSFAGLVGEGAAKAIGGAAIGLASGAVVAGVGALINQSQKAKLHVKFQTALAQVKAGNKIVKAAPSARVDAYANTVFNFAPHVATDPNLLGSILANVIQGESIDPMTIKMLTELEGRYKDNNSFHYPSL